MTRPADPRTSYIALATRLFAAQGYHGTSLAALAKEAGVSKQALLHFFGTKDKLYRAVLEALAARQMAAIEDATCDDARTHLQRYFAKLRARAVQEPEDMRLIMRALLDSDPEARAWPMKPYLDRLIALTQQTPGGQARSQAAILSWISTLIGATQYAAISATAVAGMYGADLAEAIDQEGQKTLAATVDAFLAPPA